MTIEILQGDCRDVLGSLADGSINCCVTSPPYFGLRDYGVEGQLGLEPTPDEFVSAMVEVFREVRRVLRDGGTLWLNLGDSYAGSWGAQGRSGQLSDRSIISAQQIAAAAKKKSRTGSIPPGSGLKPKDLVGIPWRVAFALQADGWYLRQDIIWHKPNPMPESVTDRCTKAHEYIFLFAKSERYYFDVDAIREPYATADRRGPRRSYKPGSASSHRLDDGHEEMTGPFAGLPLNPNGRNRRSVWTVSTKPFKGAHFATFPPDLIEPCVLAGCPVDGTVLDPFFGAGTTGLVAQKHGRNCVGIELNPDYIAIANERLGLTPVSALPHDAGQLTDIFS